jgi:8-oxo-dGTP diphosphatase
MAGIQCVAIIIENYLGEVLLQLRDDKPDLAYANHWTLPGGRVEPGETPFAAARRELNEETGLDVRLVCWRVYERRNPYQNVLIEQHVYIGHTDTPVEVMTLGEGAALRYFTENNIQSLLVAYYFKFLLKGYFSTRS